MPPTLAMSRGWPATLGGLALFLYGIARAESISAAFTAVTAASAFGSLCFGAPSALRWVLIFDTSIWGPAELHRKVSDWDSMERVARLTVSHQSTAGSILVAIAPFTAMAQGAIALTRTSAELLRFSYETARSRQWCFALSQFSAWVSFSALLYSVAMLATPTRLCILLSFALGMRVSMIAAWLSDDELMQRMERQAQQAGPFPQQRQGTSRSNGGSVIPMLSEVASLLIGKSRHRQLDWQGVAESSIKRGALKDACCVCLSPLAAAAAAGAHAAKRTLLTDAEENNSTSMEPECAAARSQSVSTAASGHVSTSAGPYHDGQAAGGYNNQSAAAAAVRSSDGMPLPFGLFGAGIGSSSSNSSAGLGSSYRERRSSELEIGVSTLPSRFLGAVWRIAAGIVTAALGREKSPSLPAGASHLAYRVQTSLSVDVSAPGVTGEVQPSFNHIDPFERWSGSQSAAACVSRAPKSPPPSSAASVPAASSTTAASAPSSRYALLSCGHILHVPCASRLATNGAASGTDAGGDGSRAGDVAEGRATWRVGPRLSIVWVRELAPPPAAATTASPAVSHPPVESVRCPFCRKAATLADLRVTSSGQQL